MAAFDLDRFFHLRERGSTVRTELLGGITTFLTMAYIVFVNPIVLGAAGVPQAGAIAATALAAAVGTLAMGLVTNYPFAMAAGMGLNAAVAFGMVKGAGLSWQTAMGVIVIEGLLVVVLVLAGVREAVFRAIPADLKRAIAAGIGFFLTFIGLGQANIVLASPATKVTFNPNLLRDPVALVALFGLVVTATLLARRVRGAMLIGISAATVLAIGLDVLAGTEILAAGALAGATRIVSWPSFETVFRFELSGALTAVGLTWVFSMLMTDFFDTMGTVVAVGREGGFVDAEDRMPRLGPVLLVDGLGAALGRALGVSSNTTYIESAAGVAAARRRTPSSTRSQSSSSPPSGSSGRRRGVCLSWRRWPATPAECQRTRGRRGPVSVSRSDGLTASASRKQERLGAVEDELHGDGCEQQAEDALDDGDAGLSQRALDHLGAREEHVGDEGGEGDGRQHRRRAGRGLPVLGHEHHARRDGAGPRQERHGERHERHVGPFDPFAGLGVARPGGGRLGAEHVEGRQHEQQTSRDTEGRDGHSEEAEEKRTEQSEEREQERRAHRRLEGGSPALVR